MADESLALIEMLGFTGIALGAGLWQLISINRTLKQTRADEAERAAREKDQGRP
jgi:erythromycin esterase-like protein